MPETTVKLTETQKVLELIASVKLIPDSAAQVKVQIDQGLKIAFSTPTFGGGETKVYYVLFNPDLRDTKAFKNFAAALTDFSASSGFVIEHALWHHNICVVGSTDLDEFPLDAARNALKDIIRDDPDRVKFVDPNADDVPKALEKALKS